MVTPKTQYARSGDVSIAYQVFGEGPDIVFIPGIYGHVEMQWEFPHVTQFFERLASFCRVTIFDKRGTGLSDRDVGVPTLEERMDDVRAVMDAVGTERAAIHGASEGGPMGGPSTKRSPASLMGSTSKPTLRASPRIPGCGNCGRARLGWQLAQDRSGPCSR